MEELISLLPPAVVELLEKSEDGAFSPLALVEGRKGSICSLLTLQQQNF